MYEIFEQLLQKAGITTYKVSKDTGISQTTFSNWKSGRSVPKTDTMQKIAEYFGVSVDYLMGGEEKDSNYYLNDETKQIALIIYENSDMKMLFDIAKDIKPEDLKAHIEFMKTLKENEDKNDK